MNVTHELIGSCERLSALASELSAVPRIAVDLESNGLFVYAPKICTLQLAWQRHDGDIAVAVVDTQATGIDALCSLLSSNTAVKVIHDLAFDARMMFAQGCRLANVCDTAIAAQFLEKPATGLGSLLQAELGISVGKALQKFNWAARPLTSRLLAYLVSDVQHLLALGDLLFTQATEAGISAEIALECEYRLTQSQLEPARPVAPYARISGASQMTPLAQAVIKALAAERENVARERDVPVFRIMPDHALAALAGLSASRGCPSPADLPSTLGLETCDRFCAAIRLGIEQGALDGSELAVFHTPTATHTEVELSRRRQHALTAWRRSEAKNRGVSEQVVLPGHCMRWICAHSPEELTQPAGVAELGQLRVDRYGSTLSTLLRRAGKTA